MFTTLEITPTRFVCGDFDSSRRYLKQDATGLLAIVSGITWEIGESRSSAGNRWVGWRYNLQGVESRDFTSFTFSGTTVSQTIPAPVNVITKVSL